MYTPRKLLPIVSALVFFALTLLAQQSSVASGVPERDERLRCACLEGRLDRVQHDLRTGYDAKRGRKLKERQRVLENQRKTECR
jgi:hypothetical protein